MAHRLTSENQKLAVQILRNSLGRYDDDIAPLDLPTGMLDNAISPPKLRERDYGNENDAAERRRQQRQAVKDDKGA